VPRHYSIRGEGVRDRIGVLDASDRSTHAEGRRSQHYEATCWVFPLPGAWPHRGVQLLSPRLSNFVQQVKTLLDTNGRAAVVVPDNVLFEGGAGEVVRGKLLHECDLHTLLRLPTGIFYAQGVKANVLFFDKKPGSSKAWTQKLWIYDFRTNKDFTLKTSPLKREDLDEFVTLFKPGARQERKATWSEKKPEGRWRALGIEVLLAREKASLDIFWLKDESLEDSANLPAPEVIAAEIAEDLRAALEQFEAIQADLAAK
jgi:type I restriction enzyme M protein